MTVKIEVCERLMDHCHHPVSDGKGGYEVKQFPRYHAQIADKPGVWAAGDNIDEAIGNLVRCHPETFTVEIDILKSPQMR